MTPALAISPFFLNKCVNGSSGTTIIFLSMLTAYGLIQWSIARKLRALIYFGMGSALLVLTNFEMAAWLAIAVLLAIADIALCPFKRKQKEAALILCMLPLAYTISLWILMNWLIMGDGFYFLRSLFSRGEMFEQARHVKIAGLYYIAAGLSLTALIKCCIFFSTEGSG
jgi:hypothetical protein